MDVDKSVLPKHNDMVTQSILLEESYKLFGTPAKFIFADYRLPDVGYELDVRFNENEPLFTNILIEDPPKSKILKQLGWSIESDDKYTKPLIATVPRYLSYCYEDGLKPTQFFELILSERTKVCINYDYEATAKVFQIMEISSNMFNPVFYYLKLVPYRETIEVDPDPINDPNLSHLDKEGQFKYLTMTPREDGTIQQY